MAFAARENFGPHEISGWIGKSGLALAVVLVLSTPTLASSAELRPGTLAEWDQYIATVDARVQTAPDTQSVFLWIDEDPGRAERVQRGEVAVSQLKPGIPHGVPHGLIHDWIGAVFVPETTLADVFAMARDYDDYPQWYGPTISQAHPLAYRTFGNTASRVSTNWRPTRGAATCGGPTVFRDTSSAMAAYIWNRRTSV